MADKKRKTSEGDFEQENIQNARQAPGQGQDPSEHQWREHEWQEAQWPEHEWPPLEQGTLDVPMDEADKNVSTEDGPEGFQLVDIDRGQVVSDHSVDDYDDFFMLGTRPDNVMDEIEHYTDDDDILADFAERQNLNAGSDRMLQSLVEHHSQTPDITANDVDAAWQYANQSGEETPGSTVPTPDQDIVEEIGEALGIEYEYDEPLATYDKLHERDEHRWELDPHSADDEDEDALDTRNGL
jgi:hypothetical protein